MNVDLPFTADMALRSQCCNAEVKILNKQLQEHRLSTGRGLEGLCKECGKYELFQLKE